MREAQEFTVDSPQLTANLGDEPARVLAYLDGCFMDWALNTRQGLERKLLDTLLRLGEGDLARDPRLALEGAAGSHSNIADRPTPGRAVSATIQTHPVYIPATSSS